MRTPSPPPNRFQYWTVPGSRGVLARPAPTGEEQPPRAAAPMPASAPRKRGRRAMGPFMWTALRGVEVVRSPPVGEPVVRLVPAQFLGESPDPGVGVDQRELGAGHLGEVPQVLTGQRGGQNGVV